MTVLAGRYELLELLGSGGFGSVYKARQTDLESIVAVKLLNAEVAPDMVALKRLQAEARALAVLDHPSIPKVHRVETLPSGGLCVAMDYIEGKSLDRVLEERGKLPANEALKIIVPVAEALNHAHQNGIIHRDLKPGNIMISGEKIYVLDFGIAKLLDSDHKFTQTGALVGTVRYMSPEQASGVPVGPQSDIYSLACVLYEMLTGNPLFEGDSPISTLMRHVQDTLPSMDTPELRPLAAPLCKALAKQPETRFASMADFAAALKAPHTVALEKQSTSKRKKASPNRMLIGLMFLLALPVAAWLWQQMNGSGITQEQLETRVAPGSIETLSVEDLPKLVAQIEASKDVKPETLVSALETREKWLHNHGEYARSISIGKAKVDIARKFRLPHWSDHLRVTRDGIFVWEKNAATMAYLKALLADEEQKYGLHSDDALSALTMLYGAANNAKDRAMATEVAQTALKNASPEKSPYYYSLARVCECMELMFAFQRPELRHRAEDFIAVYGDRPVFRQFTPWMYWFLNEAETDVAKKRDLLWKSFKSGLPALNLEGQVHGDREIDVMLSKGPVDWGAAAISNSIVLTQQGKPGETAEKVEQMWSEWSSRPFVKQNYAEAVSNLKMHIDNLKKASRG